MFQDSFFLPGPVAVLAGSAFVVLFLTAREADLQLYAPFTPVQVEWHERVTLAFNGANQAVELSTVQRAVSSSIRT